ncbi:MAG: hypothetical protein JXK05_02435 [Campylobacterales bacterium]|nr:hypothetical protein [Campylobacterales bacterium]
MSKSTNPFSTILSINPYQKTYYVSTGTQIGAEKKPIYQKNQYVISFINTRNFITAMIGISKNIAEEDIYDALENKVYDELALDLAVEYKIKYIPAHGITDGNDQFFHVFIVDPLTLEEEFKEAVGALKYIDLIVPLPLLYTPLYHQQLIDDSGLHVFIYFQENDASLTIFDHQNFVYTKSLKYSFKQMHERFIELLGEQIPYNQFLTMLQEYGLGAVDSEHQKYLIKLFGELFLHINDVLTYAKRAFEITQIDHLYIGSLIGSIAGLDEYAQTYLGLRSSLFEFEYGFSVSNTGPDQIHALMQLYAKLDPSAQYDCNFSEYHRPPPFVKRESGKLIMLSAASLVGAMLYPTIYWTMDYAEKLHLNLLNTQYRELHNQKIEREAIINIKLSEQKRYETLYNEEHQAFLKTKQTLTSIHEVKVNYPMKAKLLSYFTNDFNRFDILLQSVSYTETEGKTKAFSFHLIAKNDKQLTDLLKYLTATHAQKYMFSMDKISFIEEEKHYNSELKAVLR